MEGLLITLIAFLVLALGPTAILVWTGIAAFRARGARHAKRYRRNTSEKNQPKQPKHARLE